MCVVYTYTVVALDSKQAHSALEVLRGPDFYVVLVVVVWVTLILSKARFGHISLGRPIHFAKLVQP